MMSAIRSRIFVPVVILIVLFPVLSWALFSSASGWYVKRISSQSLEHLMESVQSMAEQVYPRDGDETLTRDEEKMYSREFLSQVREYIRKGRPEASLIAFNSRLKLTFPRQGEEEWEGEEISGACREMIAGGMFEENKGADVTAAVGKRQYMFRLYETESSGNIRGKYLVGYVEIPDTKALLSYTGGLLAAIAGFLAFLSLVAAWFVAGSISGQLKGLCRQAGAIGKGEFEPSWVHYPISEIEDLKNAMNGMAAELDRTEQKQLAFFQNASHELRTPLMSICGYAQGIQCNVFPDHAQAAAVILSETMRMKELVDGILTISRLDSHDTRLRTEVISLGEFIEAQIDILQGLGIAEKVSIGMEKEQEDIRVSADPSLLGKAFQNVMNNCARYAKSSVTVSLKREGEWAVVCVKDDGPGLDEKEIPHLFERFYKGNKGNFGIGLSITRAAMEYMGGRAQARNRRPPCHGAEFRLMLPVEEAAGRKG